MSFIAQTERYYQNKKDQTDFKKSASVYDHDFIFDKDDLKYILANFDSPHIAISMLAQMGGKEGICYALRTNEFSGLGADELKVDKDDKKDYDQTPDVVKGKGKGEEEKIELPLPDALVHRQEIFGKNEVAQRPAEPFWRLCLDELEDPMLKVLIVAGVVSIVTGAIQHPEDGWIDGLAILLAVVIVVCVGAFNNYQKEKQFRKQEEESKKKFCIVKRNDEDQEIPFKNVVVGDLIVIRAGFTIPADGIWVYGSDGLKAIEAGLTGESKELSKNRFEPLLMKGTNIVSGDGLMIATGVGNQTVWGKLMEELDEERADTPLQEKLDKLGRQIGWGGTAVAIALFLILVIRWLIQSDNLKDEAAVQVINAFIIAVTIVVVAVPEGLPLAVTISLAYSMKKMLVDNNFVRHLAACETMGNATTICSDKTGTLTTNKMSVSKCHMWGNRSYFKKLPTRADMSQKAYQRLITSIVVNTVSFQDEPQDDKEKQNIAEGKIKPRLVGGNQTDCAMLQWAIDLGADNYKQIRTNNPITNPFPFDSKVKRSSVLCHDYEEKGKYVMYVKGAAEQIVEICTKTLDKDGNVCDLTDKNRKDIFSAMDAMTRTGLRCLGTCYKIYIRKEIPFKSSMGNKLQDDADISVLFHEMIWMCVSGIADPVRDEVPKAVATCHQAGIIVRMVTGDHLETAKHIAKQCGIYTCKDHLCMTGKEFRDLSDAEKKEKLPRLRVLARSKPSDKMHLVLWYKEYGSYGNGVPDIVAVTGDGANDAPALSKADVGLSMGIQGTDVAKEASDIIIMDDNFASIEKTVMWGRSVYDNIRKFVQFQLTVNVTALTISLVGAFYGPWNNPLTAVQLLWVNLIMDTMAALALATEDPTRKLLERHPFKKDSHLITKVLWRFVFGHSVYQLVVLILTLEFGKEWLNIDDSSNDDRYSPPRNVEHLTVVFNVFVWMQIFNEINARKVNNEWNVFQGIFKNWIFWLIMGITCVAQVLLVELVGEFASTTSISGIAWAYCIGFGAGVIVWHQFVRLIPIDLNDGRISVDTGTLFKVEDEFKVDYGMEDFDVQVDNTTR